MTWNRSKAILSLLPGTWSRVELMYAGHMSILTLSIAFQLTPSRNVGLPHPVNYQGLEPDREPRQTFRPRNLHRYHSMLGTRHPGDVTHKRHPVLHGLQRMPPAFPMILYRTPAPACRAGQTIGAIVGNMNTHFPLLIDNIQRHNLPGRLKVKQAVDGLPVEVIS